VIAVRGVITSGALTLRRVLAGVVVVRFEAGQVVAQLRVGRRRAEEQEGRRHRCDAEQRSTPALRTFRAGRYGAPQEIHSPSTLRSSSVGVSPSGGIAALVTAGPAAAV
jgi:hypothetical protein